MKKGILLFMSALLCAPALAVYQVGDQVANLCWNDVNNKKICTDDYQNTVRVLLYNTGWCGPCNEEFTELSPRTSEFDGKAVTFISLSAAGWTGSSTPDQKFLQEWRDKFDLKILVAASPRDAGKLFGQSYIPNVEILDSQGKLAYKAVNPGVDVMFDQINQVLPTENRK